MEETQNGDSNLENRVPTKRQAKVRDLFTDRIVGIISGACIPLVLLFIPLINKYLDNTKEIQALQLQNNADDIEATNRRMDMLNQMFIGSQIQIKDLTDKLAVSMAELKKTSLSLAECQALLKRTSH